MKKEPTTGEFPFRLVGMEGIAKKIPWIAVWMIAWMVLGCSSTTQENTKDYLIQVNDRKISVAEFNKKFDEMNNDMLSSTDIKTADQTETRLYLLNQLIEKLILMERAEELDIHVSDEELKRAVEEIKKDYPDETFNQILLEQNVSYRQWKDELKIRVLFEKVIAKELEPLITLKPEDISAYYEKHYTSNETEADTAPKDEALNETLLKLVSNQKKEETYQSWIAELQNRYTIDVNIEAWEKINTSNF